MKSPQVDAAVKDFCDKHPDLEERYGQKYILKVALKLRKSEEPTKSLEYQPLFDTFNGIYFGDRLPAYWVRAVYDINAFFQVFWDHDYVHDGHLLDGHLPDGLILPESRTIYLRIMGDPLMPGTLVHEMAHAATRSGHDERFWAEIGRLHAAGAPVLGFELRKLTL